MQLARLLTAVTGGNDSFLLGVSNVILNEREVDGWAITDCRCARCLSGDFMYIRDNGMLAARILVITRPRIDI